MSFIGLSAASATFSINPSAASAISSMICEAIETHFIVTRYGAAAFVFTPHTMEFDARASFNLPSPPAPIAIDFAAAYISRWSIHLKWRGCKQWILFARLPADSAEVGRWKILSFYGEKSRARLYAIKYRTTFAGSPPLAALLPFDAKDENSKNDEPFLFSTKV